MPFLSGLWGKALPYLIAAAAIALAVLAAVARLLKAGRAEQLAVDQKAALEAHKRIDAANARPIDTSKELNDGTF